MIYDFDTPIDRSDTNAMSVLGYKDYLFGEYTSLELCHKEEELISMWVADMEFRTAQPIMDALQRRVEHGVFGYTQMFDQRCIHAFVDWIERRHSHRFCVGDIVPSAGVIPALHTLSDLICAPDEKILILTPSYAFFKHAADYNDLEVVYSDLLVEDGKYVIDFVDVERKARDPKVRMTFLCSPHNPTGRVWTREELTRFGQICLEHDVTIITDEIHCDLLRVGVAFTPMEGLFPGQKDKIITCMSPSKTFNLAGMQFAMIVIPDESLRSRWTERHFPIVNPLSIAAAEAAYTHGQDWLDQLQVYLDSNFDFLKTYLHHHLPKAKMAIPEATYLAWVDLSAYFKAAEDLTYLFAKDAGVLLEGSKMFVANADGYVRLNLACPRARLKRGLERMVMTIDKMLQV